MSYSQKPLIELMKLGQFPGESGEPKHIETVISNVFIFDKHVYKIYKNDNEFFNTKFRDISGKSERFDFTQRDFVWNNTLSPAIYLETIGVKITDGKIEKVDQNLAEDLVIFMNRIDAEDVLFQKLLDNKISREDSFAIGKQFAENLEKVQKPLPSKYNFYDVFGSRIADLRDWIKSVAEYISIEESGKYCDFLDNFRNKNRDWFDGQLTTEIVTDGDFHSHNAIFSNGEFSLMDTFPPKEEWMIGHRLIPFYRLGADIWALSGDREMFESFLLGYEQGSNSKIDRRLDDLFIIYASGIATSYLYMLQKTDLEKKESAHKFHEFMRQYFAKIS